MSDGAGDEDLPGFGRIEKVVVGPEGNFGLVDLDHALQRLALGIDHRVKMLAGGQVVHQFERRDLDHPVAGQRVQASGLGVEQDGAGHARSVWMKRFRIRKV